MRTIVKHPPDRIFHRPRKTLAGGSIVVEGPFLDAGDSTLAVTGGTGRYRGADGEMRLHARNAQGSEYDFTFTLHR